MADSRRWSALDHQHKGFRHNEGVGVQHAKLVTTRPARLDKGGESARLIGLGYQREIQPLAPLPALHPQKGIWSTAEPTLDANGLGSAYRTRVNPCT